eukprot:1672481-Rhodomonas_salina.2
MAVGTLRKQAAAPRPLESRILASRGYGFAEIACFRTRVRPHQNPAYSHRADMDLLNSRVFARAEIACFRTRVRPAYGYAPLNSRVFARAEIACFRKAKPAR